MTPYQPGDTIPTGWAHRAFTRGKTVSLLPPLSEWLQAKHYKSGGWSFDLFRYGQDLLQSRTRFANCDLVGVQIDHVSIIFKDHSFKVIYTPIDGNDIHCDLVCYKPDGTQILDGESDSSTKKLLKSYRNQILDTSHRDRFLLRPKRP